MVIYFECASFDLAVLFNQMATHSACILKLYIHEQKLVHKKYW